MDDLALINQQLTVYIQEKRELEKLQRRLAQLSEQKAHVLNRMPFIESRLAEEEADVDKLERRRFSRFLSIQKLKADALYQKELNEYLSVLQHRNEGLTLLNDIEKEQRQIEQEIEGLGPVEEYYTELILLKENLASNKALLPYVALMEIIANIRLDLKEVEEALTAAKQLDQMVVRMSQILENAYGRTEGEDGLRIAYNTILGYLPRTQRLGQILYKELSEVEKQIELKAPHAPDSFLKLHQNFVDDQRKLEKLPTLYRLAADYKMRILGRRILLARNFFRAILETLGEIRSFLSKQEQRIRTKLAKSEAAKLRLLETIE